MGEDAQGEVVHGGGYLLWWDSFYYTIRLAALGGGETWGAILSRKNSPLHPPRKHQGESFDSLPLDPLSTTKGEAPAGAPPLETSPGCPQEREKTPAAHFVAPPGFGFTGDEGRAADSRPYMENANQARRSATYS
ncbi:hypothetical protein CE91St43_01720 [Oscillospiraceae bacterium]|nr:hypothetical protein CE91St43_01720 [Oscillospiraceae bacterium]